MKQLLNRQFLAFLVTGGSAATVNFFSRILYNQWLSFSVSIGLAYLTGMITAFVLARMFVFTESQQPIHHSAMFFVLVNLVAVVQTWIISIGLASYILPAMGMEFFKHEIAHAFGVAVPVFTSYFGHKRWSFR
ncbi:GtrA family protein [Pseudomonas sp. B21-048]|uniref:GtrA family protein n=1 Tax=Pseudomonas sp. B21-048 TaxID=2895490 RepID=UPI00215EA00F|nr:GtrA family protein [Pseudomonas sp. B21-048]UVL00211.1 GtrA family protein [Pseudomonas sp. B21-048]